VGTCTNSQSTSLGSGAYSTYNLCSPIINSLPLAEECLPPAQKALTLSQWVCVLYYKTSSFISSVRNDINAIPANFFGSLERWCSS